MSERKGVLNHFLQKKFGNKWIYDAKLSIESKFQTVETLRKIGRRNVNIFHASAFRIKLLNVFLMYFSFASLTEVSGKY